MKESADTQLGKLVATQGGFLPCTVGQTTEPFDLHTVILEVKLCCPVFSDKLQDLMSDFVSVLFPPHSSTMDKRSGLAEAVNGDALLNMNIISTMKFPHRYTKVSR